MSACLTTAPCLAQGESYQPFEIGVGECPTSESVEQAVLTRVPDLTEDIARHRVRVELSDQGARHTVSVEKDGVSYQKSFHDPARDCEQRERFVAVFVILTIRPPAIASSHEATDEAHTAGPPSQASAPAPQQEGEEREDDLRDDEREPEDDAELAATSGHPLATIELGGFVDAAPRWLDAPSFVGYGAELRVALGTSTVAGALSVAYAAPSAFTFDTVEGRWLRVPGSLGVRVRTEPGGVEAALDVGALLVLERIEADGLLVSSEETLVEVGARVSAHLAYRLDRAFAPFAALNASIIPAPRGLRALPHGTLGTTPPLWIGATVGVRLAL